MAEPVVSLDSDLLSVEPGGQAQVIVTITNPSQIVEGYVITVLGEGPSRWAKTITPEVSIYPQQNETAIIVFAPPAGIQAPSGRHAFGVKVQATSDPTLSAVVEGDIDVGKVFGLQAKLIPVTSSGRWQGRHTIQLSNWGNAAARLKIVASDPDLALGFYVRPEIVELPLGGSATVRVAVRTRRPFLRGTPVRLAFKVTCQADRGPLSPGSPPPGPMLGAPNQEPVVDGAFQQRPILSRWVVTVLVGVVLAGIGGVVFAATRGGASTNTSLADLGTPPKVEKVRADPIDATTVEVSWRPVDQVDGYEIRPVEGDLPDAIGDPTSATGSQRRKTVKDLDSGTRHCFRVLAQRGSKLGPPSDVACAATPEGPTSPAPPTGTPATATPVPPPGPNSPPPTPNPGPTTAPPPGPSSASPSPGPSSSTPGTTGTPTDDPLGNGKWVAATGFGTDPKFTENQAKQLSTTFPDVRVLGESDFPLLEIDGNRRTLPFLAVVGPYDDEPQARQACVRVAAITGTDCLPAQPEPP